MIRRAASWLETPRGLLCLFLLGLAIRLVLARISDGLWFDVTLFRAWSNRLAQSGLAGFYAPTPQYVVDYPPGYLYVLLALGKASRFLLSQPPPVPLLKLPAIISDLLVGALAMLLAARIAPPDASRRIPVRAMAAAAILFNPGLLLVSAVWGQVDSVSALLVLASVCVLAGQPTIVREASAAVLLAVAATTKAQVIFALPVVAVFLLWRHASDRRSAATRFALLIGLAATITLAMFLPFGLGPAGIARVYRQAGTLYPFTSLWAFNLWGVAGFYRPDMALDAVKLGGIPAFYIGVAAFAATTIGIAARSWKSLKEGLDTEVVLLLGTAAVTCAAFALLTRMHERYLYLAVAVLAPLVGDRRFRWALGILSACFFMNVHFVYVYYSHHAAPPGDAWTIQPLYDAFFGTSQDASELKVLSILTAAVCLGIAAFGWEWLSARARLPQPTLNVAEEIG
jgi:dolichyl-phosphate-mannose-protein mannosyltransferase